jgi:hypothetical protein
MACEAEDGGSALDAAKRKILVKEKCARNAMAVAAVRGWQTAFVLGADGVCAAPTSTARPTFMELSKAFRSGTFV